MFWFGTKYASSTTIMHHYMLFRITTKTDLHKLVYIPFIDSIISPSFSCCVFKSAVPKIPREKSIVCNPRRFQTKQADKITRFLRIFSQICCIQFHMQFCSSNFYNNFQTISLSPTFHMAFAMQFYYGNMKRENNWSTLEFHIHQIWTEIDNKMIQIQEFLRFFQEICLGAAT